jgi:hypothetical protein
MPLSTTETFHNTDCTNRVRISDILIHSVWIQARSSTVQYSHTIYIHIVPASYSAATGALPVQKTSRDSSVSNGILRVEHKLNGEHNH